LQNKTNEWIKQDDNGVTTSNEEQLGVMTGE